MGTTSRNRRYRVMLWIAGLLSVACALLFAASSQGGPFDRDSRDLAFDLMVTGRDFETPFREPAALAIDGRSSLIYVADPKAESVEVFTFLGVPKPRIGREREINSPAGLAVGRDGSLYISDEAPGPIRVVSPDGEVSKIEIPIDEGGGPAAPGRMTVDRDGNLYVVDRTTSRIYVFDKDGKHTLTIGGPGDKRGEFRALRDVAVDRQGRIYALDSEGTPVQVFDKKGKYIYRIGFRGDGMEDVSLASGIFVDRIDQIWIVDRGQHCLKVFDRSGTFLRRFGSYGTGEGRLSQPVDAAMDDFGRIYVLEVGARRMQVFSLGRPFEPIAPPSL